MLCLEGTGPATGLRRGRQRGRRRGHAGGGGHLEPHGGEEAAEARSERVGVGLGSGHASV